GLAGGVDHVPVTLYGFGLGAESLHEGTRFGGWSGWLRGPWGRRNFTTRCQSAERKRRNDTVPPGSPQAPHMPATRRLTPLAQFLARSQHAMETVFGRPAAGRPNPSGDEPDVDRDPAQRRHAAGLMRINHVGEICAQA